MTSPSVPAASPSTTLPSATPPSAAAPAGRPALSAPDAALIEEAVKKSGLIWIAVPGARDRAAWHVWH